jgi:hypothetical protein
MPLPSHASAQHRMFTVAELQGIGAGPGGGHGPYAPALAGGLLDGEDADASSGGGGGDGRRRVGNWVDGEGSSRGGGSGAAAARGGGSGLLGRAGSGGSCAGGAGGGSSLLPAGARFESLDYEECDNTVYRSDRAASATMDTVFTAGSKWAVCFLIGRHCVRGGRGGGTRTFRS